MALPLTLANGELFANRNLIIFLTFCVIFSTLVIQGLSLRPLIRLLKVKSDNREHEQEQATRVQIAAKIIEKIEEDYSLRLTDEVLNQVKTKYEIRIHRLRNDQAEGKLKDEQIAEFHAVQQELLTTERNFLIQLRKQGKISDEVLRKIEYELDLEEVRLVLEKE